MIHPSAIVEDGARVDSDVTIGAFAIVENGAIVGAGCKIAAHAIIRGCATLGENVSVDSFSVIGGLPQDTHFDPATHSGVIVGKGTVIREHVTIHRATKPDGMTTLGAGCFLMATSHVAHDCTLGDNVILANAVLMGGHVQIGNGAFIGGSAAIHQFVRVGERAMVGGQAGLSRDMPPFCMMAERDRLVGLNIVGLRRAGFSRDEIAEIKHLFHLVFDNEGSPRDNAAVIPENNIKHDCGRRFVDFFKGGKRGFMHTGTIVASQD